MKPWLVGAALLGIVLAVTWPVALHPLSTGFGFPGLEAVDHLWALWAAGQSVGIVVDEPLINYPSGYRWVLVDPLNLPVFWLGTVLGGVGLGWNMVAWFGLGVAGVAAGLWARTLAPNMTGAAAVASALALSLPTMAGSLYTGMSEVLTMGWAAVALWALWTMRSDTPLWRASGVGALLGITIWGGPYTALYTAMGAAPLVMARLWSSRRTWREWSARLLMAAAIAALLASPVLWALIVDRPQGLPGSDSSLPMILANPQAPQNLMLGAEPFGLLWPIPGVEPLHSVFVGSLVWVCAGVGMWHRRAWGPICAVGLLCAFGLGFFLQSGGQLVTWQDRPLGLPALWLTQLVPVLGRAVRWHRAIIPASLLLAGMAGVGVAVLASKAGRWRGWVMVVLTGAMVAEGMFRSPLPWPRPCFTIAAPSGYAELGGGPILPLPLTRFSSGDPQQLRSPALLWQTQHGHPLGGNPRQPGERFRDPTVAAAAQQLLDGDGSASAILAAQGFVWVLVQHPHDVQRLRIPLGEPDVVSEGVWAWRIDQAM